MSPRRLVFACLLALAAPGLHAQSADLPKKEISEKTSGSLGQLRTFTETKDYAGALALLDRLLAEAAPASFDTYVLSQIKAQVLLTQGRLAEAIAPLETAFHLAETNANFFDSSAAIEQLGLLAQLYYQKGAEAKAPAAQNAAYEQALALLMRRLERDPRPSADTRLFAASLLYQLGTLDPAAPDPARIREAMTHAREGLLLAPAASAPLTQLLVACQLQLGENAAAADTLETLARRDAAAGSWPQLLSLYLSAAAETKDPAEARAQNLRALHVLDRAQAAGRLATPKDRYTRVAILFNLQQFARAAALLEAGLADGGLEDTRRNWELLASAYQQTARDEQALDALARAVARFPADAALEFSLAQQLHNAGRSETAYARAESALAKGLDKPGPARVYLAYLAYELRRYDAALAWIDAARGDDAVSPATLEPLAAAIQEALALRAKTDRS